MQHCNQSAMAVRDERGSCRRMSGSLWKCEPALKAMVGISEVAQRWEAATPSANVGPGEGGKKRTCLDGGLLLLSCQAP